jgi:hypothetical protein
VPRLLPILALPLLLDIVATATAKILGAGTSERQSIDLLRHSSQTIDGAGVPNSGWSDHP